MTPISRPDGETLTAGGWPNTEGGVRVPAFAWWPSVIEGGQIVNDIVHETDLYTTFARIGQATDHVPRDRVIDGLDQTSLLLKGDTHGRRDYVHIYVGDTHAATVKGRIKRHWITEGIESGVSSAFFDLIMDPREMVPMLNPRPETLAIAQDLDELRDQLPFDPFEFMEWEPPQGRQTVNIVD